MNEYTLNAILMFIHILWQQATEPDTIPVTTPVQDTNSHMTSDHSFNGSGKILQSFPFGLFEIVTEMMIKNFILELFGDFYQQQSHPPDDPPPSSPSVCSDYSSKHNSIPIPLLLL